MIYAILDGQTEIGVAHLNAALAVWDYCQASAKHIFGEASGDPLVDDILEALTRAGADGLTPNKYQQPIRPPSNVGQHRCRAGAALREGPGADGRQRVRRRQAG